ncbi:MAG: sterol desaturase family protein [Pseudomonadota bacterium]
MIPAFDELATTIDDIFFLVGAAILLIEIAEMWFKGDLRRKTLLEMVASISTQIPYLVVTTFFLSGAYAVYWVLDATIVTWSIPVNLWTLAIAIVVADVVYYWEHRIAHRVRLLWTQHAVHHSSRDFNLATAVRFGPLEGFWGLIAYLPMAFMGFAPEVIVGGSIIVLAYQTWLHTELIGKLGPVEWIMNTPSHHRVHHGSDMKYLDKNYAGIFIIWDRMFGSFQEEEETPRYGLVRDFDSQNPIAVWFSELPGLFTDLSRARSLKEFWMRLFAPPDWKP